MTSTRHFNAEICFLRRFHWTPNCYATPSSIFINLIPPESRLRGLYFLPLIVCVYLLSHFRGGLRKTHDRRRGVRNDPSMSSEVDDFRVIWKGLCDFLLLINSNQLALSLTVSEIRRLIGWKSPIFPTHLCSTPNLKMFPLHKIAEILRTASEDTVLINRVIKFHLAQRMWSALTNVTDGRTDRQTSYDGNTAPLLEHGAVNTY